MSWFYEKKKYQSEKNGTIICERFFGRWYVTVNSFSQSSPYVFRLWKHLIHEVPRRASIKKILFLGLGAGANFRIIKQRFPKAQITVVEWDPVMLQIARDLRKVSSKAIFRLFSEDAVVTLQRLKETFDLILCDLFFGNEIMGIQEPLFRQNLVRILDKDGYLFVNAGSTAKALESMQPVLAEYGRWKRDGGYAGLFRHFGLGLREGDPLPQTYKHFRAVWDFLEGEAKGQKQLWRVGSPEQAGLRWKHGPFWFEGYVTNTEPRFEPAEHWRLLLWRPLANVKVPPGWWRTPLRLTPGKTGFVEIKDAERYWESWDHHAIRHRARWLKETEFITEEIGLEAFIEAYQKTKKLLLLKGLFIGMLRRRFVGFGELNHYFVVRRRETREIVAGLAVLDIPSAKTSLHLIAFYFPSVQKTSVNVGLIDEWFKHCIKQGITFVEFDMFRGPGDPSDWEGFSRFKGQFGTRFILHPKALIKLVRPEKKTS